MRSRSACDLVQDEISYSMGSWTAWNLIQHGISYIVESCTAWDLVQRRGILYSMGSCTAWDLVQPGILFLRTNNWVDGSGNSDNRKSRENEAMLNRNSVNFYWDAAREGTWNESFHDYEEFVKTNSISGVPKSRSRSFWLLDDQSKTSVNEWFIGGFPCQAPGQH